MAQEGEATEFLFTDKCYGFGWYKASGLYDGPPPTRQDVCEYLGVQQKHTMDFWQGGGAWRITVLADSHPLWSSYA